MTTHHFCPRLKANKKTSVGIIPGKYFRGKFFLSCCCDCLRPRTHSTCFTSGRIFFQISLLIPDPFLAFFFLLTALWTCVKHLTSQKNSARKQKKHELRVTPSPTPPHTPVCLITTVESCTGFTPGFVSPANIFSPSRSKSATVRHSAETPPYATIETVHSRLLSSAGCSEQLLQTAPFLYLTLLFGE